MISIEMATSIFFELDEDWEKIIDPIFTSGGSDVEAYVALGLSREEHNGLLKHCDDYFDAFDNGMAKSEAYWIAWARSNINVPSKEVNTKLFEAVMNRVFAWDKKRESREKKVEVEIKKDENKKEINKFAQKFKLVEPQGLTKSK